MEFDVKDIILSLVFAIVTGFLCHEGGHYATAKIFGKTISFHFEWGYLFGKIPVPRGIWTMPDMEKWKQKIVALAGFTVEFIVAAIFAFVLGFYMVLALAVAHLILYPLYSGDASDFKWL